jgi:uncharacterized protein (UPF0264 family)
MIGSKGSAPRFLASVRSADEARIALAGGADIIDAKEPDAGALGAVTFPALMAIVQAVNGQRPVSATVGDCALDDAASRVRATAETGIDYVKIGLFDAPNRSALGALERCAEGGTRLIAVIFADRAPSWAWVRDLAEAGFAGVMLDTADKRQGGLLSHLGMGALADFLAEARAHRLLAGLAGSLRAEDIRPLMPLMPDVLGFRGALCANGSRGETLQIQRIKSICGLIRQGARAELTAGVA